MEVLVPDQVDYLSEKSMKMMVDGGKVFLPRTGGRIKINKLFWLSGHTFTLVTDF